MGTLSSLQQEAKLTADQIAAGERRLAEIQAVASGSTGNLARLSGEVTQRTPELGRAAATLRLDLAGVAGRSAETG